MKVRISKKKVDVVLSVDEEFLKIIVAMYIFTHLHGFSFKAEVL